MSAGGRALVSCRAVWNSRGMVQDDDATPGAGAPAGDAAGAPLLPGFEAAGSADPPAAPDLAAAEGRVAFPPWPQAAEAPATARTTPAEPQRAALPPRAGFGRRALAMVLDLALLSGVEVVLGWTAALSIDGAAMLLGHSIAGADGLATTLGGAGAFLLPVAYFTELHAGGGQTLGKALVGIRVARPDGEPIGHGRSLLRWFGYTLSSIPMGLGFLAALGPGRRALHDLVAGTAVLDVTADLPAPGAHA